MSSLDPTVPQPIPFSDLSIFRNTPAAEVTNSDPRWHPKITAYRLLVISTTISLGSAKAAATFYGKAYVSTTIEWIAEVTVFTLLFVVGWFKDNPSRYPKLAWLVDSDLVRLIWSPKYTSEERQQTDGTYPHITSYRLLVSGSVFLFGMVKAYLSYVGLGGAANVLDWIFGVIVTSILYVLGLYEYNPVNMVPYLFDRHYDSQFYSARSFFAGIVLFLIGLGFTVWFSFFCSGLLHQLNTDIYEVIQKEGLPTSFGQIHEISQILMLEGIVSLYLLLSIGCSLYFLRKIVSAFGSLTPFRKLTKLLRRAILWIPKTISCQFGDFNTPAWAKRALSLVTQIFRFLRHFGAHILVFMAAAIGCAVVAFFFLGLIFRVFDDHDPKDTKLGLVRLILHTIAYVSVPALYGVVGMVLCIRQVLLPFSQDLDNLSRYKLALEF